MKKLLVLALALTLCLLLSACGDKNETDIPESELTALNDSLTDAAEKARRAEELEDKYQVSDDELNEYIERIAEKDDTENEKVL